MVKKNSPLREITGASTSLLVSPMAVILERASSPLSPKHSKRAEQSSFGPHSNIKFDKLTYQDVVIEMRAEEYGREIL